MPEDRDFQGQMERLEKLLHETDRFPEETRRHVRAVVEAVLDLHGAGLEKIFAAIGDGEASGGELVDRLADDELVSDLLVLHGLHPLDRETRVRQALDEVRPRLRGDSVELVSLQAGVARLRVDGGVSSRRLIEDAILGAASDVAGIEFEETTRPSAGTTAFVPLEQVGRRGNAAASNARQPIPS